LAGRLSRIGFVAQSGDLTRAIPYRQHDAMTYDLCLDTRYSFDEGKNLKSLQDLLVCSPLVLVNGVSGVGKTKLLFSLAAQQYCIYLDFSEERPFKQADCEKLIEYFKSLYRSNVAYSMKDNPSALHIWEAQNVEPLMSRIVLARLCILYYLKQRKVVTCAQDWLYAQLSEATSVSSLDIFLWLVRINNHSVNVLLSSLIERLQEEMDINVGGRNLCVLVDEAQLLFHETESLTVVEPTSAAIPPKVAGDPERNGRSLLTRLGEGLLTCVASPKVVLSGTKLRLDETNTGVASMLLKLQHDGDYSFTLSD